MPRVHLSPFLLESGQSGAEFDLDPETAKKLVKVLRLTPGETFVAFDGRGREWECALATVEQEGRPRATAVILEERAVENTRRLLLSVAQAIPKGDKLDFVLQKGTEIGVAEFWPFEGERSVSRLDPDEGAARAAGRTDRWRRIAASAAAQCGRADVPIVHAVSDLATVVDSGMGVGRVFMLDESAEALPLREALAREPVPFEEEVPPRVMLLVGPEGGWSARERDWATRYGAEPVHLGARILRTETAALVAATVLFWEAGEL